MRLYTYSEARQNFSQLLNEAYSKGDVRIKRKDGLMFILKYELPKKSPLDVEGMDIDLKADEIVKFVKKGRKKYIT